MKRLPLLIAAVLAAFAVTFLLLQLNRPAEEKLEPLKPKPGEELRLQQKEEPPPKPAEPAAVLKAVRDQPQLAGDEVLVAALGEAIAANEAPSYKALIDTPISDNAGPALRDEVHRWIGRKMAGLGFTETAGKPNVVWAVHVDPAEAPEQKGHYAIEVVLRQLGKEKFRKTFDLPPEWKKDRLDTSFASSFAAPRAGDAAAAPQEGASR